MDYDVGEDMTEEQGANILNTLGIAPEKPEAAEPEEPEVEEDATAEAQEWVHPITGKKFDTEAEYLRYDNSFTNDKYGKQMKELREELEELKSGREKEPAQPQVPPMDDLGIMKQVWDGYEEDVLKEPYAKFVFKGIKALDQGVTNMVNSLRSEITELREQIGEERALASTGVPRDEVQGLLKKHPSLGSLPFEERMAVIQDMIKGKKAPEAASQKLKDRVPQRKAEDHVEGSAQSSLPDGGDAGFDGWLKNDFTKKPLDEQLSVFSQMVAKSRKTGDFYD